MTANDDYILEILQSVGLITTEQASQARKEARDQDKAVIDVLAGGGVVPKIDILKALANQFGMDTIRLEGMNLEAEVIDMVPPEVAGGGAVVFA